MIFALSVNKNAKRGFNIPGTAVCMSVFCGLNALLHFSFVNRPIGAVEIAAIHGVFNIVPPYSFCLSRISDHAINIVGIGQEMKENNLSLSANNPDAARHVEALEEVIDDLTARIRDKHIARFRGGECRDSIQAACQL